MKCVPLPAEEATLHYGNKRESTCVFMHVYTIASTCQEGGRGGYPCTYYLVGSKKRLRCHPKTSDAGKDPNPGTKIKKKDERRKNETQRKGGK